MTQSGGQKEENNKAKGAEPKGPVGPHKQTQTRIVGVPGSQGSRVRKGPERLFEEIMAENFQI